MATMSEGTAKSFSDAALNAHTINRPPSTPPTDAPAQFGSKRIMDIGTLSAHLQNALARSNHIGETLEPLHKKPPNQSGHQKEASGSPSEVHHCELNQGVEP